MDEAGVSPEVEMEVCVQPGLCFVYFILLACKTRRDGKEVRKEDAEGRRRRNAHEQMRSELRVRDLAELEREVLGERLDCGLARVVRRVPRRVRDPLLRARVDDHRAVGHGYDIDETRRNRRL